MNVQPTKYSEIPFQFFNKSDRLGQILDWTASAAESSGAKGGARRNRGYAEGEGRDEDDMSFSLVDGGRAGARGRGGGLARGGALARPGAGPRRDGQRGGGRGGSAAAGGRGGAARSGRRGGRVGWGAGRDFGRDQRNRESSIKIGENWHALEEIEFSRLSKLRLDVDTEEVDTLCVLRVAIWELTALTSYLAIVQRTVRLPLRI